MKLVNTKPIAILLGVYNGSKYLSEQLDSLISQTNKEWTLYIRDDSSTDNSCEIISRYCQQNANFISIEDDKGNLKSRDNFFQLLDYVDSDYYMFCDQDDVWLPQKVELTFTKMQFIEKQNFGKRIVVFTDLKVVDVNLNIISSSFWHYSRIDPEIIKTFNYLSVCNVMTGCTMMINKEAYKVSLPVLPEVIMHDCWIALKTVASGGMIDFIKEPTILYRQHDSNVIGATEIYNGYFIHKLKTIPSILKQNKLNLKMIGKIKRINVLVYLYYKFFYFIKRQYCL